MGINRGVTNFARSSVGASPQLTVDNNSAANACSQRHADNTSVTASGTHPHLADGSSIRIVLKKNTETELFLQASFRAKFFREGRFGAWTTTADFISTAPGTVIDAERTKPANRSFAPHSLAPSIKALTMTSGLSSRGVGRFT